MAAPGPALPDMYILCEPMPGLSNSNPVQPRAHRAFHSLHILAHFCVKVWGQTSLFHSTLHDTLDTSETTSPPPSTFAD